MSLSARLLYTTHNKKNHPKVAKVPVTDAHIRLSTYDYIAVGRLKTWVAHPAYASKEAGRTCNTSAA